MLRPKRELPLIVLILVLATAAAVLAIAHRSSNSGKQSQTRALDAVLGASRTAIAPRVALGGHLFVQFACASCHGPQGSGGVSPDVPALKKVANTLTVSQLSSIIRHGLGESANPKKPFMPVWGPLISKAQVTYLVAYIRAGLPRVPDANPAPVARDQGLAVAGAALFVRYGCINCHGPNGLGGVPNPQSPDKSIPPLAGQGFRTEFNTDAKILGFIRSGSVIGEAPVVSMPHWGGIIPQRDLNALVAYLKTLKSG